MSCALRSTRSVVRRWRAHQRGVTTIEFAFVAPALFLMLIGFFDIAHTLYTRAVLEGAVQKAGRDSSLETGTSVTQETALDARVSQQVHALTGLDPVITRRFYRNFSSAAAARAETYTDTNGNGICDAGEAFVDTNNNGTRDLDGADQGQGSADDSVLYTVTASYPRMFPLDSFIGVSPNITMSARTVFSNQPYNDQNSYGAATTGHCP